MTKKSFIIFSMIALLSIQKINAAILVLSGMYQGKNVFIQNPQMGGASSTDYCVNDIYVNDQKILAGPKQQAFEIDLSNYKVNQQITIKITHKDQCKPRLINPQAIKPSSSFHFMSTQVDKKNIVWSTRGEKKTGKFVIEYYANDTWVFLTEQAGKNSMILNNYTVPNTVPTSRKFRIIYKDCDGKPHYSNILEIV